MVTMTGPTWTMRRRAGRIMAGVVVAGALVAACSGDEQAAGADGNATSPLAEFLGDDGALFDGDSASSEARFQEQERARQEAIAACMREQGFEYTPVDPAQYSFFDSDDEGGLEYGSEEWVAKYGFGITTQALSQETVGPDLVGYDFDLDLDDGDGPTDPNQKRYDAMSEGEQRAYDEALYGDGFGDETFDETGDDDAAGEGSSDDGQIEFYEPGGCEGETLADDTSFRFFQDFGDELEDMWDRALTDPRIVDAEREIAECVAGRGLDFTTQQDVQESLQQRVAPITEAVTYPIDELSDDDMASMSEEQLEAVFARPATLTNEAKAQLAELQQEEIELATAVYDCGGGSQDLQELYQTVMADYEQEFIDQNRDRLADYGSTGS